MKIKNLLFGMMTFGILSCQPINEKALAKLAGQWRVVDFKNELILEITDEPSLKIYTPDRSIENDLPIARLSKGTIKILQKETRNLKYSPPEISKITGFQMLWEDFGRYKIYTYQMIGDTLVLRDVFLKLDLKALRF